MIPVKFLQKMGIYNLDFNGVAVQAKVVDNEQLVDAGVAQLKSRLDSTFPIVGCDLKFKPLERVKYSRPQLLLLYVHDFCLIVQLGRMSFPSSLVSFLGDQSICFLGVTTDWKREILKESAGILPPHYKLQWATAVDIGTFAARALKNPALEKCINMEELASKAGCRVEVQVSETKAFQSPETDPDWGALCFPTEDVKYAMHEAYMCYTIGTRLMNTL